MLSNFFGVFSLILISVLSEGPDFNYYHTTASLKQNILDLSKNCNGFLTISKILTDPEVELILIKDPEQKSTKKAFFLFGEHARELISPETGLLFLKQICNSKSQILEKYEIQIVLNANPLSREKVEKGEYCLRVNENGVDLNRNWNSHWEKNDGEGYPQTNPGEAPFSEPETIALKNALDSYQPFLFLTVHSGTMGMYTPYAYSEKKAVYNENNMLNVLSQINSKHCACKNGAAGKEVGYLCPGTCLDYAYDNLKVPYVFAWEIYDKGFDFSRFQTSHSKSFLQINENIKKEKKAKKFMEAASCFIQVQSKLSFELSDLECFEFFNPTSLNAYHQVTENWAQAFFDLLEIVHKIDAENEKKIIHFKAKNE